MLQLGIITDEVSQDLDTALAFAKEQGLTGVEIRTVWEKNPFTLTAEEGERILRSVQAKGLRVCGISAPFFKCPLDDEEEQARHMEGLQNCIRLAKQWGVSVIRGFPFWRCERPESRLEEIAERFFRPSELLREEGLFLALESDPTVNASDARELASVLSAVSSSQVKALWDPGNDLYAPTGEIPYPDGYEQLRGEILHVHLKDAVHTVSGEAEGCCLGDGLLDLEGQLRALLRDEYQGWVVLEPHYRLGAALSEELLKRPGGAAFSAEGYEPSRRCAVRLRECVKRLTKPNGAR